MHSFFPQNLVACVLVCVACDSELSQFDKVEINLRNVQVAVDPTAPVEREPALVTVDAGADFVTNAAFERGATSTSVEPLSFLWEKVAGDGEITFSAATADTTTISADADGVYVIRVTAQNEYGDEGTDEFQLTWDASSPTAASGLLTRAGGSTGPDVRVTKSTIIYFDWEDAVDAGAGIRDYTLTWYDGAGCTGTATVIPALAETQFGVNGVNGDTMSFKVTSYDELGQESTSACSDSITIDTVGPAALTSFTGATGTTVASNNLTLDFASADVSDYKSVTIRRLGGNLPPADCLSGVLAVTLTTAQLSDPKVVKDTTTVAEAPVSYIVCLYDEAGNVTTDTEVSVTTKKHIVFTTSDDMDGKFDDATGGIAAADAKCTALAATSVDPDGDIATETSWKAIVSSSTVNAVDRILIYGNVYSSDEFLIATSSADMWDNTIGTFIGGADESENPVGVGNVWTGTLANGTAAGDTCGDWGNTAVNGTVGNPSGDGTGPPVGDWIDVGAPEVCTTMNRLYCISQP